jgi:hypothetical protein
MLRLPVRRALLCVWAAVMLAASGGAVRAETGGAKWALVIGVQDYSRGRGFASLQCAVRDARDFCARLVDEDYGGYAQDHVKLLVSGGAETERPTNANILSALHWLAEESTKGGAGPPDTVLVYFSGHGLEKDGKSYLIPEDALRDELANTAVPLERVSDLLGRCKARKQIVILDACRSQSRSDKGREDRQTVEMARALEEFARATGRVVLTSCSEGEASYETSDQQHSAFTQALLDGTESGSADSDGDGVVSITEAQVFAAGKLPVQGDRAQRPKLHAIEADATIPLMWYPRGWERVVSIRPPGAHVWVDGEDQGDAGVEPKHIKGPRLKRGEWGTAEIRVEKDGYQEARRAVRVEGGTTDTLPPITLRESALFPPGLRPTAQALVATTISRGVGDVRAFARDAEGRLYRDASGRFLVTVGAGSGEVAPGVYLLSEGHDLDPTADAYSVDTAFVNPNGVVVDRAGRVVVADSGAGTVWSIASRASQPQALTTEIPGPREVRIAPHTFRGPKVKEGDLLVCASSPGQAKPAGLYVIDGETRQVRQLVGPSGLANDLLHAEFGRDGKLYAVEDDATTLDFLTIVTISAEGKVTPILTNYVPVPGARPPVAGPLALGPPGETFFAYGSSIYHLAGDGSAPTVYASGGETITALAFASDGSLLVSDAGSQLLAKVAPLAIEGSLLVSSWWYAESGKAEEFSEIVAGEPARRTPIGAVKPREPDTYPGQFDLSPDAKEVVYSIESWQGVADQERWNKREQVLRANLAGSDVVDLSGRAGLTGISCIPRWSPDGKRVVFRHCDPVEGSDPCQTGLDIWVANVDGTGARQLAKAPPGADKTPSEASPYYWWNHTGDRVVYRYGDAGQVQSVTISGAGWQRVPAFSGNLSPDGTKIADERTVRVDGEEGVWRQLCLTNPDGSGLEVLVQHFVKDSDVVKQVSLNGKNTADSSRLDDVRTWVGPRVVTWSPSGRRIAFLAALFFHPEQEKDYKAQLSLWIYDRDTHILTRVAGDGRTINNLSWRGPRALTGAARPSS